MITVKGGVVAAVIICSVGLAGCGAPAQSAPGISTMANSEAQTPTPTPTPDPEAERGSRANPLAVGEVRKISAESIYTVGADGATQISDGLVILPIRIAFDWAVGDEQAEGADAPSMRETGVDPWQQLTFTFVTASGRSYLTNRTSTINFGGLLELVGIVYPPTEAISAIVPVSVPDDDVPGGVWVVENIVGSTVFIAQ